MGLTPQPSRKRDRICGIFRRFPSPSPSRTGPAAASNRSHSQGPPYTGSGSSILADALEALHRDDRETIRDLLPTDATSIDAAFDEIHIRVKDLQKHCANKGMSWYYRGRQTYLVDQVDKVMQLLDRFKSVGDVVANVDPVHIGLPWAGIRVILEVRIRSRRVCIRLC